MKALTERKSLARAAASTRPLQREISAGAGGRSSGWRGGDTVPTLSSPGDGSRDTQESPGTAAGPPLGELLASILMPKWGVRGVVQPWEQSPAVGGWCRWLGGRRCPLRSALPSPDTDRKHFKPQIFPPELRFVSVSTVISRTASQ